MKKALFLILLIAFFAGLLSAGPVLTVTASPRPWQPLDPPAVLLPGQSIGQTFFSAHAGLDQLRVYLFPGHDGGGILRMSLLAAPDAQEPLADAEIPLREILEHGEYVFHFPPLPDSYLKSYYTRFEIAGSGAVGFLRLEPQAYYEGAMYVEDEPVQAQLSFQAGYDPVEMGRGIARQVLSWFGDLFLCLLLFILPGWSILSLTVRRFGAFSFGEKLGAGAGVSVALYPLILVWTDFAAVYPGQWIIWLVLAFDALFVLLALVRFVRGGREARRSVSLTWDNLALIILIGLLLFTRLWAVRTLPSPLGLDSVQHGAITRLIMDNGGLFQSWMPYTPYRTFTMHFGFHSLAAMFSWLSGKDVLQSILLVGQVINVLAVLALYPLAVAVSGGKRWAGVGAVLAGGLLSPMPAFYVNWGRYPQLAGMLLLPLALWFLIQALESRKNAPVMVIMAGLTLASMFLSYYRLPFFYVPFVLAWVICWAIAQRRWNLRPWLIIAGRLVLIAGLALLLVSPWLGRLLDSRLNNEEIHGTLTSAEAVRSEYEKWTGILFYAPVPLLAAAGLGALAGLLRRSARQFAPVLWLVGLFLTVALALLNVPGADLMQSGAIMISIYAPLCLLAGNLLAAVRDWAVLDRAPARKLIPVSGEPAPEGASPAASPPRRPDRRWKAGDVVTALFVIVVASLSVSTMSEITNAKNHGFFTWADLRAMSWVSKNLPANARFWVESQRFKETSAIGGDAGWWLPVITGRQANMPPQYALVMEYPNEPGYNDDVIRWTFALETTNLNQPEGLAVLCEGGFNYVYLGQKIFYTDPLSHHSFYTFNELETSPYLRMRYREDSIAIYELLPGACQGAAR